VQRAALGPSFIQIQSTKKKLHYILLNSRPRDFAEFSFQISYESEEVSMDKVVHIFEIFKTIFYFNFLELKKVPFGSVKIWKNWNIFEPFEFENGLNCFDPAPPETVAGTHWSAPTSPLSGATRTSTACERCDWAIAGRMPVEPRHSPTSTPRGAIPPSHCSTRRPTIKKAPAATGPKLSPRHHFSSQGAHPSTHLRSPCLLSAPAYQSTARAVGTASTTTPSR
jgi:hypothetical protein